MPAQDYIPSKEGDIVPWTENFVQVASANAAALGLGTVDITALKTKNADYATKLNIAIAGKFTTALEQPTINITSCEFNKLIVFSISGYGLNSFPFLT